jgi:hypothetical protein
MSTPYPPDPTIPPPPPPPPYTWRAPDPARGLSIAALVSGIVGVVFGLIPITSLIALAGGLVALVLGLVARRQRMAVGARRGIAVWGASLGVVALVLGTIGFIIVQDTVDDLDRDLEEIEQEFDPETIPEDEAPTPSNPSDTTTTTPPAPAAGSRENPFALGTPLITDDGLQIVVNAVDLDAGPEVAAENQFNEPAPEGFRFIMANVSITNSTAAPVTPWLELDFAALGSQNVVYNSHDVNVPSVVAPEDLSFTPELYPGGAASGNEVIAVPEAEIIDGSLLLMVSPSLGDPVFVTVN